jgi:IS30 family transposase
MLIRRAPAHFETITADDGTEDFESVKGATGVELYYATPDYSWETGTNESFNGLQRQCPPKQTSQANDHATRLRSIGSQKGQHTQAQEASIPHTGGTFPWNPANGALQT